MADEATFGERLLALLDQTSTSTTYKYALLLAIIDSLMRRAGPAGEPADTLPVRTLAERVIELYWDQASPYPATGGVLRQSQTGQAEIVTLVRRLREGVGRQAPLTLAEARAQSPELVERLIDEVEWKLIEMPLPRLQRVQGVDDPFLYEIEWDESVRRSDLRRDGSRREIRLRPGVGRELLQLATLVRPLVERLWAGRVVAYNRLPEGDVERFLFGSERLAVARIRLALVELQAGRCFYTGRPLRSGRAQVDHFLPWARVPTNAIENLVVADARVNRDKRAFLAGGDHVARWRTRLRDQGADLAQVAAAGRWETDAASTLSLARAVYLRLGPEAPLWVAEQRFEPADPARLRALLAA